VGGVGVGGGGVVVVVAVVVVVLVAAAALVVVVVFHLPRIVFYFIDILQARLHKPTSFSSYHRTQ
jgi:hypothetical protein